MNGLPEPTTEEILKVHRWECRDRHQGDFTIFTNPQTNAPRSIGCQHCKMEWRITTESVPYDWPGDD